jgi:hypothetical protein
VRDLVLFMVRVLVVLHVLVQELIHRVKKKERIHALLLLLAMLEL